MVVGSGASITSDAHPGRVLRELVSYIDPTLDTATRTAQARIEFANPGQALKIGMFGNVAFAALSGAEATTLVIPKSAVQNIPQFIDSICAPVYKSALFYAHSESPHMA